MLPAPLQNIQTGCWSIQSSKGLFYLIVLILMMLIDLMFGFSMSCVIGVLLIHTYKNKEVRLEILENHHYCIDRQGPFFLSYFYFGGFYIYLELTSLEGHQKHYFFVERWTMTHKDWRKLCMLSSASFNLMRTV